MATIGLPYDKVSGVISKFFGIDPVTDEVAEALLARFQFDMLDEYYWEDVMAIFSIVRKNMATKHPYWEFRKAADCIEEALWVTYESARRMKEEYRWGSSPGSRATRTGASRTCIPTAGRSPSTS